MPRENAKSLADKLAEDGYDREQAQALTRWVALCSLCISINEDMLDVLASAITNLCVKADGLYAKLMTGEIERASMAPKDLGENWTFDLQSSVSQVFVELTGTLLFAGNDGPRGTAMHLIDSLSRIKDGLREEPDLRRSIEAIAEESIDSDVLAAIRDKKGEG